MDGRMDGRTNRQTDRQTDRKNNVPCIYVNLFKFTKSILGFSVFEYNF
jgi:hypothetical protein